MAEPPDPATLGNVWDEAYHACAAYLHASEFDVIHDHSGIVGPFLGALLKGGPPIVTTLHGPWTDQARRQYALLDGRLHLVAISASQRDNNAGARYGGVVHHGLDPAELAFRGDKVDELAFVGRASPDKGLPDAIAVADQTGLPLVVMVKINEADEKAYWREVIEPLLHDRIEVIPNADTATKVDRLGRAKGLIFPITWDEPFGLVMIEALACGTPVVATRRGSAPEIVVDGETGFLVDPDDSVAGSVAAVARLDTIDPWVCRRHFEVCFSADRMVDQYESLFNRLVRKAGHAPAAREKSRRVPRRVDLDPGMAASR
jgi:glycosyltransferase involved in cell wall biosynthesis